MLIKSNLREISFTALICAALTLCNATYAQNSLITTPAHVLTSTASAQAHEQDALQVLSFIDSSQKLRKQLPNFIQESNQAISKHNGALPSAYGLRLAKTLAEANVLRDSLFKQALTHRGALYRIDDGISDQDRVTEIVIAMSSAITLFENSKVMQNSLAKNRLLRNKLNEGYPEFGIPANFYNSSTARANNIEYRKTFTDAIRYFKDNKAAIEAQIQVSPTPIQSLYSHIAQSSMLIGFKGNNIFKGIVTLSVKAVGGTVDISGRGLNTIKFTGSKVVGNTMGTVRWRDGKLKNDQTMMQALYAHLQPGDILLEKTPFTLTDKSIPGHFGHAAIYVGTKEQLNEIGVLNEPLVQKNLAKISAGHGVVEALRSGVQLNKLQDFMNVDDVAILRPKNSTLANKIEAVKLALGNIGKKYDFNFDVNTTDTIVCSELVYIAYPQVDFITKNVLGSFAITPDDIALRAGAQADDPLQLVLFGHDGKLVFDQTHNENGLALYDKFVKGAPLPGEKVNLNQGSVAQRAAFSGFIQ